MLAGTCLAPEVGILLLHLGHPNRTHDVAGAFIHVSGLTAEGDKVAVSLLFGRVQKDEFCGVASAGKTLKFDVLGSYRFTGGKIIEVRKLNIGHNHDFISARGIREQLSA